MLPGKQLCQPLTHSGLIPTAVPPSESVPGLMGRNTLRRGSLADNVSGFFAEMYATHSIPYIGDIQERLNDYQEQIGDTWKDR